MQQFILLNVQFSTGRTRTELINADKISRIIESPAGNGSSIFFGVEGPAIQVTETIGEILHKLMTASREAPGETVL
jgi:H+/Cl- antiporter ClcA